MSKTVNTIIGILTAVAILYLAPIPLIPTAVCRITESVPPPHDLLDTNYKGALPWEHSLKFRKFITDQQTPVRMSAYYTRTNDPVQDETENIAVAADALAGTVLKPGEVFSFNQRVGPYTAEHGFRKGRSFAGNRIVSSYGGGVCQVSSVLYTAAVLAGLQIVERHPHSMTVSYVPSGQDAAVCYGIWDFRLRNNSGGPVVLWADTVGRDTYIAIYGRVTPAAITWHHKILKTIPACRIYSYHPSLPPGTENLVAPGQDGVVVENWTTKKQADGSTIRQQMGIDYYRPSPRIIARGPRPPH